MNLSISDVLVFGDFYVLYQSLEMFNLLAYSVILVGPHRKGKPGKMRKPEISGGSLIQKAALVVSSAGNARIADDYTA